MSAIPDIDALLDQLEAAESMITADGKNDLGKMLEYINEPDSVSNAYDRLEFHPYTNVELSVVSNSDEFQHSAADSEKNRTDDNESTQAVENESSEILTQEIHTREGLKSSEKNEANCDTAGNSTEVELQQCSNSRSTADNSLQEVVSVSHCIKEESLKNFRFFPNDCYGKFKENSSESGPTADEYAEMEEFLAKHEIPPSNDVDRTVQVPKSNFESPGIEKETKFEQTSSVTVNYAFENALPTHLISGVALDDFSASLVQAEYNVVESRTNNPSKKTYDDDDDDDDILSTERDDASSCSKELYDSVLHKNKREDKEAAIIVAKFECKIFVNSNCITDFSKEADELIQEEHFIPSIGVEAAGEREVNDKVLQDEITIECNYNQGQEEVYCHMKQSESAGALECCESQNAIATANDLDEPVSIRLTESEMQLGKTKPIWIADGETTVCMICSVKFNLIIRRHHCRCCGRVLCGSCTSQKATLSYMNVDEKFRVCQPCLKTLQRIEEVQKSPSSLLSVNERSVTSNYLPCSSSQGILKSRRVLCEDAGNAEIEDCRNVCNEPQSSSADQRKRSVKFIDGINPGEDRNATIDSGHSKVDSSPNVLYHPKKQKHSSRRAVISRRIIEVRLSEEVSSYLPTNISEPFFTDVAGTIQKFGTIEKINHTLSEFLQVDIVIYKSFSCSVKVCKAAEKKVLCVITNGMADLGLDEIFLAYFVDNEVTYLTYEIIKRIQEIYDYSITSPKPDSEETMIGLRMCATRVPTIQPSKLQGCTDEFASRTILLHRPSMKQFDSFIVPCVPFLIATFIHSSELSCARALPQRLLYRIGLQASYYPTPIVNDRKRAPVYHDDVASSILKVFNDLKNWTYTMPLIRASTLLLENGLTSLFLPKSALGLMRSFVKISGNMIAWALDFNMSADSHLVCEQGDRGSFSTRIFTNGTAERRATGASFLIFDGSLKDSRCPLSVKVVEDGVTIRLHSDAMALLCAALCSGNDFNLSISNNSFYLKWIDMPVHHSVGELISPIDNTPLMDKYQYGIIKTRALSSLFNIVGSNRCLRLASIIHIGEGRIPVAVHARMFGIFDDVAAQIAYSLSPFINSIMARGLWPCNYLHFRIQISPEDAEFLTIPWIDADDYLCWTQILDEKLIPFLYTLCSFVPSELNVELILSVRPALP